MDRFEYLDAARQAVTARQQSYGGPEHNFSTAAAIWSVILGQKMEAHQVALCLDAVKTARLINDLTHMDSWVDKAGYSSCGAEVAGFKPSILAGNQV
ncbi:DUF6378 domain-containing protein [Xanthobacteraceae bacterium A53D]